MSGISARMRDVQGERAGFHGCQMPEQLLGRIIKGVTPMRENWCWIPLAGAGRR